MNATYIIDLKIYHIKLNHGLYMIDGKEVLISSPNPVVVNDIKNIVKIQVSSITDYYKTEDSDILDVIGYNKKLIQLMKSADDDMYFDDIDAEYEYKKFKEKYKPVYKQKITKTPIEFDVSEYEYDTGNQFIESPILTTTNILSQNLLYVYKRKQALSYLFDIIIETIPSNIRVVKSHSLEFAKLNGKFIFTKNKDIFNHPIRRGTLDDLRNLYEEDAKLLNMIVKKYLVMSSGTTLNDLDLTEANKLLDKISYNLDAIIPIKRHNSSYTIMRSDIQKLKTAFNNSVVDIDIK